MSETPGPSTAALDITEGHSVANYTQLIKTNIARGQDTVVRNTPGMGTIHSLIQAAKNLELRTVLVSCTHINDPFELTEQMRRISEELGGPDTHGGLILIDEFARTTPHIATAIAEAFNNVAKHGLPASAHRVWVSIEQE